MARTRRLPKRPFGADAPRSQTQEDNPRPMWSSGRPETVADRLERIGRDLGLPATMVEQGMRALRARPCTPALRAWWEKCRRWFLDTRGIDIAEYQESSQDD